MPTDLPVATFLDGIGFFFLAAIVIGAAVSAVTMGSIRHAAIGFAIMSLALALMFFLESGFPLAAVQTALGALTALVVWRQVKAGTSETSSKNIVVASPNRTVAVFILLCFMMSIVPIWVYSIWVVQPTQLSPESGDTAFLSMIGENGWLLVWLTLLMSSAFFALRKTSKSKERAESPVMAQETTAQSTGERRDN